MLKIPHGSLGKKRFTKMIKPKVEAPTVVAVESHVGAALN